ncbi:hamartin isoform X2 [Sitophilus oryzae]|uniref:Hamartin isoform X2 n=1 Tax=Sitophilus oryzae TaxID=7048 RepID=A0A6J2YRZ1_SITOR|nr:hamartin isoform X2 [Sitophilus oryzae]
MSHHQNQESLFEKLESNDKKLAEDTKYSIWEQFSKTQEPYVIHGLYEYYLSTSSVRCIEIIIALKEPHQQFLFDRLLDSIRNPKTELTIKVQAFTLLGHIARSQPSWLYKIQDHPLFREILKFLTTETELLPLISALLVLIIFLPMFPTAIGEHYLNDIFEIFRRLAAWNSHVPGKLVEDQMIHLQVALYALFLRLYGMFPQNFLYYLRSQFKDKNNPVFCHTIKPMMDTVKMHPSLVTTSKENETTTERWKKMSVHDVIVECERFSLDITDRCPHETCQNTTEFRSRSGTMNSAIVGESSSASYHQQNLRSLASLQMAGNDGTFFSPSQAYQLHQTPPIVESQATSVQLRHIQGHYNRGSYPLSQEGSPPEAAIEATPETTPIRDFNTTPLALTTPPTTKSNVARALTSFRTNAAGHIVSGTPANSVPSSPMRKEPSPFVFPSSSVVLMGSNDNGYLGEYNSRAGSAFARAGGVAFGQHLSYRLSQERAQMQVSESPVQVLSKPPPSSPLKIKHTDLSMRLRTESPSAQEDEEVCGYSSIANKHDYTKKRPAKSSNDNVLPDLDDSDNNFSNEMDQGSPCSAGGLHMPNSKSFTNFKKRIRQFSHSSQYNTEPEQTELSTGSSPGNGVFYSSSSTVRRANSCPDMKKSPQAPLKDNKKKPFYETDEETVSEDQVSNTSNGVDSKFTRKQKFQTTDCHTQTEVFWPMPYEHLFLTIFPSLKEEANETKASPSPSPAPVPYQSVEQYKPSLYDILDRYIENCVATSDTGLLKNQLQLLHQQLLFERHRRETHAYRNRRLLSDAKSTRLLKEYNSALRDQVQLEQKEIDDLRRQLEEFRLNSLGEHRQLSNDIGFLQDKCKSLTEENDLLNEKVKRLESEYTDCKINCSTLDKRRQQAEAALLDALAEVKFAKEQAMAGEQVKQELQRVNRELLLIGELHVKYKERLDRLSTLRQCEEEVRQIKDSYKEELKAMNHTIELKSAAVEAYKMKAIEMEHLLQAKDEVISAQKRTLSSYNENEEALLESIQSKYETQLSVNCVLEEKILELKQKLEAETARRKMNSPDTSSCHEVQATTTAGLSPHSSPLSASLASSAGSTTGPR